MFDDPRPAQKKKKKPAKSSSPLAKARNQEITSDAIHRARRFTQKEFWKQAIRTRNIGNCGHWPDGQRDFSADGILTDDQGEAWELLTASNC